MIIIAELILIDTKFAISEMAGTEMDGTEFVGTVMVGPQMTLHRFGWHLNGGTEIVAPKWWHHDLRG